MRQSLNLDKENIDSLLKLLGENYNIDFSGNVLEEIEEMANKSTIKKHEEHFPIWQSSNGRFMTYLPDKTKKNNRRLVSKLTREHLDNTIIDFYRKQSSNKLKFHTLYYRWLNMKRLEVSGATIERLHTAYRKFYEKEPINEMSVTEINFLYLKTFLLSTIKKYNMDYKQYTNFSCILRGVLQFSLEDELIISNPFDRFHLGKNVLRQSDTKKAVTEVYTIQEREKLEKLIWADFRENPVSTVPLAVLLDFYTGLRSGELVTISKHDIEDHCLHIHRTETSYTEILPDGTKGEVIYEVKEAPKSSAGFRDIFITKKAREVLDTILAFNQAQGWDNEYLFLDDNERIIRKRLDTRIRKYCRMLGITEKSMHKIRKYYISALKLNGVPDEDIKRLAGHRELTTTYNSYCFSVLTQDESNPLVEAAL